MVHPWRGGVAQVERFEGRFVVSGGVASVNGCRPSFDTECIRPTRRWCRSTRDRETVDPRY